MGTVGRESTLVMDNGSSSGAAMVIFNTGLRALKAAGRDFQ